MAKPWDETMKKLIYANPQQLLDWLKTGGKFLHFEPTELFTPKEEEEPSDAQPDLMAIGAIFVSLVYGQHNTAEQTWLERVIQDMYDIIQQTPLYQSWTRKALEEGLEKGLKEGRAEGLLQGKLEGLRETLVNVVRARFPRLASLARTQVAQINDPDVLGDLIIQVSTVSKAQEVRRALLGEDESGKG
jgi:flagellar biosynthesis/type III secretory pathway protein FliH